MGKSTVAVRILLLVFVATYLLFPYKTQFAPIALFTLVLFPAMFFFAMCVAKAYRRDELTLPADIVIFLVAVVLFLTSAVVVHYAHSSPEAIRAMMVAFASFLFVRVAVSPEALPRFFILFRYYLIASGILVLLQVFGGEKFYITEWFGGGVPSTKYGAGFSNFVSLGAVLMLWLLCALIGRMVLSDKEGSVSDIADWLAVVLGTAGLYFALSRAAHLALFVALVYILAVAWYHRGRRRKGLTIVGVVCSVFALAVWLPNPLSGYMGIKHFGGLSPRTTSFEPAKWWKEGCGSISAPTQNFSTNTRIVTSFVALDTLRSAPLWGIGLGEFRERYRECWMRIPAAEQSRLDSRARMTPHNAYLQYASEVGLLPFLGLAFWLLMMFAKARRGTQGDASIPFVAGLLAVMVFMLFHDLFADRIFWIAAAFASALLFGPVIRSSLKISPVRSKPGDSSV